MARTSLAVFIDGYEVKNGQVGSQDTLNRAVHQVKQELDELWNWSAGSDTTNLPETRLWEYIIDDNVPYANVAGGSAQGQVAGSREYIQTYFIDHDYDNETQTGTLNDERVMSSLGTNYNIQNAVVEGGVW